MNNLNLLDPIFYYKSFLKEEILKNSTEYFNSLLEKSGIDTAENDKTVSLINKKNEELSSLNSKIKSQKSLSIFLFILSVIAIIYLFLSKDRVSYLFSNFSKYIHYPQYSLILLSFLSILLFLPLAIYLITKIKNNNKIKANLEQEINNLKDKAYSEVLDLITLLNTEDFIKVINSSWSDVKLYSHISSSFTDKIEKIGKEREDSLDLYYSLYDVNNMITSSYSGVIDSNQFIYTSYINHFLGTKTYDGYKAFPYTVTVTDSNGNLRSETRYETLHATVTKPCPYYTTHSVALYLCPNCERLSFTRHPNNIDVQSDSQLKRKVKKNEKLLIKKEKKALKLGENFTSLSDVEFETIFNSNDRDDDVTFRVMYTPLVMKNFKSLVKDNEGIGDKFSIIKEKSIMLSDIIDDDNLLRIRPLTENLYSYSHTAIKENFLTSLTTLFKNLYFSLSPMFMIPPFSSFTSSNSFDNLKEDYSSLDISAISFVNSELFRPEGTKTTVIINSSIVSNISDGQVFLISSFAYDIIQRVESVYAVGFNTSGYVPVYWDEYILNTREERVFVKELTLPPFYVKKYISDNFSDVSESFIYANGFILFVLKSDEVNSEIDYYKNIVNIILEDSNGKFN